VNTRLLHEQSGQRTFALVFRSDEEVLKELLPWARDMGLSSASFTGIGAFRSVTLGYFDVALNEYAQMVVDEQVEVLTLAGNVVLAEDGNPKVHAHVVIGKRDGTAHGGHLLGAVVRPTLELMLVENPPHLRRRVDAATGLPLLDLDA
jgi:predicted DNA-binding protein with PD1-like motif